MEIGNINPRAQLCRSSTARRPRRKSAPFTSHWLARALPPDRALRAGFPFSPRRASRAWRCAQHALDCTTYGTAARLAASCHAPGTASVPVPSVPVTLRLTRRLQPSTFPLIPPPTSSSLAHVISRTFRKSPALPHVLLSHPRDVATRRAAESSPILLGCRPLESSSGLAGRTGSPALAGSSTSRTERRGTDPAQHPEPWKDGTSFWPRVIWTSVPRLECSCRRSPVFSTLSACASISFMKCRYLYASSRPRRAPRGVRSAMGATPPRPGRIPQARRLLSHAPFERRFLMASVS